MCPARIIDDSALRNLNFVFRDRDEAGIRLTQKLLEHKKESPLVLAIPSGGVPIGFAIAQSLEVPIDLIVARKIPLPYTREAGFGATTWDDITILNKALISAIPLSQSDIERGIAIAQKELKEKTRTLRGSRPLPEVREKTILLADDGLASGYTMLAAITYVRKHGAKKTVVAVPTASAGALTLVTPHVDEIICLNIRERVPFAVADAYNEWHDLTEKEVRSYLSKISYNGTLLR